MRFLILILSALLIPTFSSALTVDEAVALAIDNSNSIKQQQEILSARAFESDNSILVFMPSIGAQAGWSGSWTGFRGGESMFQQFMGQGMTSAPSLNPFSNNMIQQTTITAYLNFNIFNGLYDYALRGLAAANYEAQDYQVRVAHYDTILNTRNAYIGVVKAQRNLEASKENVVLLQQQRKDALISYNNGLLAKKDILQFDLYLSSAELMRITEEANLNIAIQQLENAINRQLEPGEELVEPSLFYVRLFDLATFKELMFSQNSSLKVLEKNYLMSQKQETMKRQTLYPKVDASFQYQKYFGQLVNMLTGLPATYGRDSAATVGFTASWNIISATSAAFQAQAQKKQTMALGYSIADIRNNLVLDLQSSIEGYNMSSAGLEQATINVKFAEENYRNFKLLFDQSAATTTELLDASVLLNKAKVDRITAMFGVISAIYKLERLIEQPLEIVEGSGVNMPDTSLQDIKTIIIQKDKIVEDTDDNNKILEDLDNTSKVR